MRTNSTMDMEAIEREHDDKLERDVAHAIASAESGGLFSDRRQLRRRLEAAASGREFCMLPADKYRQAAEGRPLPGPNNDDIRHCLPSKAELEQWREAVESPGPRLALQRISPHFRFERTGTKRFKVCEAQQARIREILDRSEGN